MVGRKYHMMKKGVQDFVKLRLIKERPSTQTGKATATEHRKLALNERLS